MRLGDGTATNRTSPVQVGTATTWTSLTAGGSHTCGVRTDRTAWCWGRNFYGSLGNGTTADRYSPVQAGTATTWTSLTAGADHTCAARTDRTAWCWGNNNSGQLGFNSNSSSPVAVLE